MVKKVIWYVRVTIAWFFRYSACIAGVTAALTFVVKIIDSGWDEYAPMTEKIGFIVPVIGAMVVIFLVVLMVLEGAGRLLSLTDPRDPLPRFAHGPEFSFRPKY